MADKTPIEWTDATWNPVRGCTRISDGCRHCYAETVAARFSGPGQPFHGFAERGRSGSAWTGRVEMVPAMLDTPLGWQRPRRIFANSMSDLFHDSLPDQDIATVYGHAIAAQRVRGHTIQILTKRAERMRTLLSDPLWWVRVRDIAQDLVQEHSKTGATDRLPAYGPKAPPAGIWPGVSVENQDTANERIPHLLATPGEVLMISAEPLLGPLDLCRVAPGSWGDGTAIDALRGGVVWHATPAEPHGGWAGGERRLGWVIAGGESGPGARPAHQDWFRALRDQCADAGVPFFFKQWGEFQPVTIDEDGIGMSVPSGASWRGPAVDDGADILLSVAQDHRGAAQPIQHGFWSSGDGRLLHRSRKEQAGAVLDGREHREFPPDPPLPGG